MNTRTSAVSIALMLVSLHVNAEGSGRPALEVEQGTWIGTTENGVASFKEIHYAAPPMSELRWRPPQPAGGWSSPRHAGEFGNRPGRADERYAEMVGAFGIQFAKTGNPNGNGLPGWPATTPGNDLVLEFGQTCVTIHRNFRATRRDFWEGHFDSGKL